MKRHANRSLRRRASREGWTLDPLPDPPKVKAPKITVADVSEPRPDVATRFRAWKGTVRATAKIKIRELGPAALLIIALPMLLVAANSIWIFTLPGWIDAWVYFGHFQHPVAYKSTLFPDTYYGSRLPWILPGYLAYHLFEAKTANYVLHFAFYYAATFSLYSLLRRAVGSSNALLGAVLFGTYTHFLSAIGWDYVDGAGDTYFLVALAAAAQATAARRQFWLVVSGMAGLAMCYTNIFLLCFLPIVPGLYLFMMFAGASRKSLRVVLELVFWFGAGAVMITGTLGVINHFLDRHFWFYWPSIRSVVQFHGRTNPWVARGWAWARAAVWLGIPLAASVASIAYLFRDAIRHKLKLQDFRTFFVLQFLVVASGMVVWQIVGSTGLYLPFYASYLIPSMFLAIGCILARSEQERPGPAAWVVILGSSAVLALSLHLANSGFSQLLRSKINLIAATVLAAAGLLCNVLFWRKWYVVVLAVAGLATYQIGFGGFDAPSPRYEAGWRNVVEGARAIWPYEQTKLPVWFWYDASEPHGTEFYSINAVYLWGYSYVGPHFPAVEVPSRLEPGATIVMSAKSAQWVERANEVLRPKHLRGTSEGTYTLGHDSGSFQIGFLKLEGDPPLQ